MRHVVGLLAFALVLVLVTMQAQAHAPPITNLDGNVLRSDNALRFWARNSTLVTDVDQHATAFNNFSLPLKRATFEQAEDSLSEIWTLFNDAPGKNYADANDKICCTGDHNHTLLNYTFDGTAGINRVNYKLFAANSLGTGDINVTIATFDASDIALTTNNTRFSCASGSKDAAHAFNRVVAKRVRIFLNVSACQNPGTDYTVYANGITVWSTGNKEDAVHGTHEALEYADWLVNRTGFRNIGATLPVNFGPTTFEQVLVSGGVQYYFTTGGTEGCGIHPWHPLESWRGDGGGPASLTVEFMGFSSTERNVMVSAWRLDNTGPPTFLTLAGTGDPTGVGCSGASWWIGANGEDPGSLYTNTEILNGDNWTSISGFPLGQRCADVNTVCIDNGLTGPQYGALLYHRTRAVFRTVTQDRAFDIRATFDLTNATLVSLGFTATRADNTRFNIPINSTVAIGNAYYLVLAARNATATPNLCDPNMTILAEGKSVPIAWTRNSVGKSWDGFFIQACGWLLRDIARSERLPDIADSHSYVTSSLPVKTYKAIITADLWPQSIIGETIFGIQSFRGSGGQGKHAEHVQCAASPVDFQTRPVCFGNIDTGNIIGADAGETTWRLTTSDASQSSNGLVQALGGVRVQDFVTVATNVTLANGTGTLNTSSSLIRFVISKAGYRTEYANFTKVPVSLELTFDMHLTANFNLHPSISCSFNVTASRYDCVLRQFNTTTEALEHHGLCSDALDVTTNACVFSPGGPRPRILVLDCSRDSISERYLFDTSNKTSTRWTVQDSTGIRFTVFVPRNAADGAMSCDETLPLEERGFIAFAIIQSGTVTFTLNTPGFRTIRFTLDGLVQGTIIIQPFLADCALGGGAFCRAVSPTEQLQIRYVNETRLSTLGGEVTQVSVVFVRDVVFVGDTTLPDIPSAIAKFGYGIGFRGSAGPIWWGVIIFAFLFLAMLGLVVKLGVKPEAGIMGVMALPAFFAVAAMGLFPTWLVILIVLSIVLLAIMAFRRQLPGGE